VCHFLICTFVRLRIACITLQLKFYGVRALGPVTPVKAKYYAHFCLVVVGGVLSHKYEMRQLLVAHRKADSYLLSPSGGLLVCILRDPRKYKKNTVVPKSSVSGIKLLLDWRAPARSAPAKMKYCYCFLSSYIYFATHLKATEGWACFSDNSDPAWLRSSSTSGISHLVGGWGTNKCLKPPP